jgi:hypothetical protein
LAVLGKFCCNDNGYKHSQSKVEILKTLKLINRKSKCYMKHLIGKLPCISIASIFLKKSTKLLSLQQPAKNAKSRLALLVL